MIDIPRRAVKPSSRRLEKLFDIRTAETLRWIQFIAFDDIRHFSGLFEQILTVKDMVDQKLFYEYILSKQKFSKWKRLHKKIKRGDEQSIKDSNFWHKVIKTMNEKTAG